MKLMTKEQDINELIERLNDVSLSMQSLSKKIDELKKYDIYFAEKATELKGASEVLFGWSETLKKDIRERYV